ncbi:MAG: hypothetical protein U0441_29145 [Polyangiaceae bacterium]
MARSDTKQVARAEGRLRKWDELTEDQQGALERACVLLGDMASRSWEPPKDGGSRLYDFLPPIDAERHNHVLLIDGGRGTGKTAVLIALLSLLSRKVRGQDIGDDNTDEGKKIRELADLVAGVVPVGLVDLQPLPPSTNLLIHLVGQLQRVVEALSNGVTGGRHASNERAPWEAEDHPESAVRKAWRDFLNAAALGWGGEGVEARRAHLDPEAFTFELEQTERSRIDVPRAFRNLLDTLAKSFRDQRLTSGLLNERYPLFLIPVDDADMNPERAVELLDLVRTLWHPRAAFVLTGNSDLFRARLHAQLRRFLIPTSPLHQETGRVTDVVHLETDLVRQIYRKAIPPAHRLHLTTLRPEARQKVMSRALSRVPAPEHPLHLQHLTEYFDLVPDAASLLPENLRELIDIQTWLSLHADSMTPAKGLRAARLLRLLTSEDFIDERSDGDDEWPSGTSWEAQQQWRLANGFKVFVLEILTPPFPRTIWLANSARLQVVSPRASEREKGVKIFWLDTNRRIGRERITPALPALVTATTPGGRFDWPLPDTNSVIDLNALHICLQASLDEEVRPAMLVKRYIATILDYEDFCASEGPRDAAQSIQSVLQALGKKVQSSGPAWETLASLMPERANRSADDRGNALASWAERRVAWFAAPEMGLGPDEANRWLAALKDAFGDSWATVKTSIQDSWTNLLQERGTTPAALTWGAHQDERLKFDWVSEIEQSSRRALYWANLVKQLSAMDIPFVAAGPATFWPTYVSSVPERAVTLAELPESTIQKWEHSLRRLQNDRHVMSGGLLALWKLLGDGLAAQGLPPAPKALNLKSMKQAYKDTTSGTQPWIFEPSSTSYLIEHDLKFRSGKFTWTLDSKLSSPLARTLFELFWDFTVDASDVDNVETSDGVDDGHLRWWPAIGRSPYTGGPIYGWPAVDWWSFLDHHLLVELWNKRCAWLQARAEAVRGSGELGEELAFWYVRVVDGLLMSRGLHEDHWMNSPRVENWSSIFATMEGRFANRMSIGARCVCYREWFYRVPLLAAPESGLSEEAAERILTAFGHRLDTSLLRSARRDRIRDTFGWSEKDPIEEHLASIDADVPKHPWIEQIEKATPAKNKDAPQDAPPRRRRSSPRKS